MKRFNPVVLFCFLALSSSFSTLTAQLPIDSLSLELIFHEPYLPGVRPTFAGFGPKNDYVYFNWNDSSKAGTKLYRTDLKGKSYALAPEKYRRNYTLSPDGKQLVFTKQGNLILADADFENQHVLVASKSFDYGPSWSPDGKEIAYISNGNAWVLGLDESSITQLTQKEADEPGFSSLEWVDQNHILLRQYDSSDSKRYYFPEYAGKRVNTGASNRGISTITLSVVSVDSGKVNKVFTKRGWVSDQANVNTGLVVLDETNAAMKKRGLHLYDVRSDSLFTIFEDSTKGWISDRYVEFSPDGTQLLFLSEYDGWAHIYHYQISTQQINQITSGAFEVEWVNWTSDNELVYASNEVDPGEVHLYRYQVKTGKHVQLTSDEAHRRSFRLHPDKQRVVYTKTYFNEPADLFLLDTKKPGKEIQLTRSIPDRFNRYAWQQEDYVRLLSRDGKTKLSASILTPDQRLPGGNPVVVFAHGAGSLQNVFKGWSFSYWREYMFHQFLAEQGYYVLEVDYRHSLGYGRKFREDVTNWMGKYEIEDIEDGLSFLAENYEGADTSRVGIYGGSYGGFLALYAVGTSPDRFDAAAALRAVTKWENYYNTNPWYTLPRLGNPEAFPEHYTRSNPITYADSLQQPVLILHGLIDNNVGFQDAVQYIERLIQTGNTNFEMMMYPTERHSFEDQDAWHDEYRRIYEFFEREL
ncbi:MAG: prolyl oligopeptidase family serine peptidase [Bacteroidota bacterium]